MKLISKFCAALAAMLVAATASAGTLYWQVTPDTGVNFSAAKIVVTQGDNRVAELGETFATDMGEGGYGTQVTLQQTNISAYSSNDYSFFVEMVNYATNPETVNKGYTYSYNELLSAGYVSFNAEDVATVSAAATARWYVLPAPAGSLPKEESITASAWSVVNAWKYVTTRLWK